MRIFFDSTVSGSEKGKGRGRGEVPKGRTDTSETTYLKGR